MPPAAMQPPAAHACIVVGRTTQYGTHLTASCFRCATMSKSDQLPPHDRARFVCILLPAGMLYPNELTSHI